MDLLDIFSGGTPGHARPNRKYFDTRGAIENYLCYPLWFQRVRLPDGPGRSGKKREALMGIAAIPNGRPSRPAIHLAGKCVRAFLNYQDIGIESTELLKFLVKSHCTVPCDQFHRS